MEKRVAIIGAGNLGQAIASGLIKSDFIKPSALTLSRRHISKLNSFKEKGVNITRNNIEAVENSDIIILSVKPNKFQEIIHKISPVINKNHILISVITGIDLSILQKHIPKNISVFRAMPNTAIAIQESMTCISASKENDPNTDLILKMFNQLGKTALIEDELMDAATVLAASGIAFALRYIRASMQAGIEIGFQSDLAQLIAAQTAKGASSLILQSNNHPEKEIDKVTTPLGITITGLNQMEFNGFSSSSIKGVLESYKKIKSLNK